MKRLKITETTKKELDQNIISDLKSISINEEIYVTLLISKIYKEIYHLLMERRIVKLKNNSIHGLHDFTKLELILSNPSIEYLSIQIYKDQKRVGKAIEKMKELKGLSLNGAIFGTTLDLNEMPKIPKLRKLSLKTVVVDSKLNDFLSQSKIEKLSFGVSTYFDEKFEFNFDLSYLNSLKIVSVDNINMKKLYESVRNCSRLKSLKFVGQKIPDIYLLKIIAEIPIEKFDLSVNEFFLLKDIYQFHLKEFRYRNFSNEIFRNDCMMSLKSFLEFSNQIEILSFENVFISNEDIESFSESFKNLPLKKLILKNSLSNGFNYINEIIKKKSLVSLEITDISIRDCQLNSLKNISTLKTLKITSNTTFTNVPFIVKELEQLYLYNFTFSDEDFSLFIKSCKECHSLQDLLLVSKMKDTSKFSEYLASNPKLSKLYFKNDTGEKDELIIESLENNTNLKSVDLILNINLSYNKKIEIIKKLFLYNYHIIHFTFAFFSEQQIRYFLNRNRFEKYLSFQ